MRLDLGINQGALANAASLFKNLPVNEAGDVTRLLRYLQPFVATAGEVVLLGKSWNPDIKNWDEKNIACGDVDVFGTLKRLSKA